MTPQPNAYGRQNCKDVDNEDSDGIEQAFIFSPSTGDLSQYTRPTQDSSIRCSDRPVRKRHLQETPTRKPFYKSGSALKQSFSTLFERSTSIMKMNSKTPTRTSRRRIALSDGISPDDSLQPIVAASTRRSKSGSGLNVTPSREELMPQSPTLIQKFLPATPSPLRHENETQAFVGKHREVTASTPVIIRNNGSGLTEPRRGTVESGSLSRHWQRWDSAPASLSIDNRSKCTQV